ncbi:hypothetical protein MKX08_002120 [Trichoderma sp. CBMAI-0020]|nr:hypothetical protein MKX08_002120 [Trichoderma sp. CBMAI-0020]
MEVVIVDMALAVEARAVTVSHDEWKKRRDFGTRRTASEADVEVVEAVAAGGGGRGRRWWRPWPQVVDQDDRKNGVGCGPIGGRTEYGGRYQKTCLTAFEFNEYDH